MGEFQIYAEWKIRRLPEPLTEPKETYGERVKRWAMSSIGIDNITQDVMLYLEKTKMGTADELATHFVTDVEKVLESLDALYTAGLINRLGKAFIAQEDISSAITQRLIPRIMETLRGIAKVESSSRSYADFYRSVKGRAFSDIREAVVACNEIFRMGGSPSVRVLGVQGYTDQSVEVEGPVLKCGLDPAYVTIVSGSGDKVVIGGREAKGVDVRAHTVIIKGEKNE